MDPATCPALDKNLILVGCDGKDRLKQAFAAVLPDEQRVFNFISKFQEVRKLHHESINPVLDLLEAANLSRNRMAKEIMAQMISLMNRQIKTLDQARLTNLLEASFTYLTVPELSPIVITTMEHLKVVNPEKWRTIVANGLDNSPYTDLPLSLKHRIWVQESSAYEHELDLFISKVQEPILPTMEELVSRPTPETRKERSQVLKDFLRAIQNLSEDMIYTAMEKLHLKATIEQRHSRRVAIADFFHDLLLFVPVRTNNTLLLVKKIAKALDKLDGPVMKDEVIQEIRDALSASSASNFIALLLASSYSRDLLADQLVVRLYEKRGIISPEPNPEVFERASRQLLGDPSIVSLMYLCVHNLKSGAVLSGTESVKDSEVQHPFQLFLPLILSEMQHDSALKSDHYYVRNAEMPNSGLTHLVSCARLERRVVTTYCLQNYVQGDVISLSRFGLLLDAVLGTCDAAEDPRESVLAEGIILKIMAQ